MSASLQRELEKMISRSIFSCIYFCAVISFWKIAFARVIPVAIFHTEHEGSHAIGSYLANLPCTFFLSEHLDGRYYNSSADHSIVLETFFNKDGLNLANLFSSIVKYKNHPYGSLRDLFVSDLKKHTECERRGIVSIVVTLCRFLYFQTFSISAINPSTVYFLLARTNLMNFALSISRTEREVTKVKDPQFLQSVEVPKLYYPLDELSDRAHEIMVRVWRSSLFKFMQLRKRYGIQCRFLRVIFYEDFLLDADDFAIRAYRAIVPKQFQESAENLLPKEKVVSYKKVHPNDISKFVKNSAEVFHFFTASTFPAYGSFLKNFTKVCSQSIVLLS